MARALQHLGHDVILLSYPSSTTLAHKVRNRVVYEVLPRLGASTPALSRRHRFNELLLGVVNGATRPDLVVVVKGDMIEPDVFEACAKCCTCVYWGYDDPYRYPSVVESLGVFAVVASFSKSDARRLAADGFPSVYLPLGFDSDTFGLSTGRLPEHVTPDVSFVGARYPEREEALASLLDSCTVGIWGGDWRPRPWRARYYQPRPPLLKSCKGPADLKAADRIYRSCKVNLNIHGDWDGLSMRVFEIPGAGGFQLCDTQSGIEEMFDADREIVLFGSIEELKEKAIFYLRHDAARARIAAAGHERAHAEHALIHRMRALLDCVRQNA
jgi:spore maturation protein CgeB